MRLERFTRLVFLSLLVVGVSCGAGNPTSSATTPPPPLCAEGNIEVSLVEINDVLVNPGMGFTTFNRVEGDPLEGGSGYHPATSLAYYRWYLPQIEPTEGAIAYEVIDKAIARAQEHGQKLAFRVMSADTESDQIPAWLKAKGIAGVEINGNFVPDFNDEAYLTYAEKLIAALGARYDGNPAIDHVDLSMLGLWGETHVWGVPGAKDIQLKTFWRMIAAHRTAFPNTKLVIPINNVGAVMKAVGETGFGWRGDCLGDLSDSWSHMRDMYPTNTANAGVTEAWKTAPVVFEVCWDIPTWVSRGWDLSWIFDQALDVYHCSVVNAKSFAIPEEARAAVDAFQRRMGYRFVLRTACHPSEVFAGQPFVFKARWANVGVAPAYDDYRLAYRLRGPDGSIVWSTVSGAKLRQWLPGTRIITEQFTIPKAVAAGDYVLETAMLWPTEDLPALQLAIAGKRADGWYPVSTLSIRSAS